MQKNNFLLWKKLKNTGSAQLWLFRRKLTAGVLYWTGKDIGRIARCLWLKNAKLCFKKGQILDFATEAYIDFKIKPTTQ